MSAKNLQELLDQTGDTVELLRNSQLGAYIYPVVPAEFTNWRREQKAWRETAVLYDQSHHMVNLFMRGPGRAQADLRHRRSTASPTSRSTWPSSSCPTTPDGDVIGDGILFHLAEDEFVYVGRAPGAELAAVPRRDRRLRRRHPATTTARPSRPYGKPVTREYWRFQIQGPNAWQVIEKLNGGTLEQLKFFRMGDHERSPASTVRTLRHGMAGAPGLEIWGPYDELRQDPRRDPRGRAGVRPRARAARAPTRRTRSSRAGSPRRCRPSTPARSCGRTASGCGADSYEATNALAGSFVSDNIEDYYLNPWELGYGSFVKFDHDFIGRDALEEIDPATQRKKVTLAWNAEDLGEAPRPRWSTRTARATSSSTCRNANYGSSNYDSVVDADGNVVGLSMFTGVQRERAAAALSLATVDPDVPIGAEVTVVWGEPDGGTRKTTVEPHELERGVVVSIPGASDESALREVMAAQGELQSMTRMVELPDRYAEAGRQ